MKKQYKIVGIVCVIMILLLSGSVFGKESLEFSLQNTNSVQKESSNYYLEADIQGQTDEKNKQEIRSPSEYITDPVEEKAESSFIIKLGTFLLISTVLIFLLQWHRKKKN
jgi:hypothetical protein